MWVIIVCILSWVPVYALGDGTNIRIGENVQVSSSDQRYSLGEVTLSADPDDPNRLLGCGIVYASSENRRWTVAYLSTDRGVTWHSTLDTKRFADSFDEFCAFSSNGVAYYIAIGTIETGDERKEVLAVYRSSDGGETWLKQDDLAMDFESIDRESLVIDPGNDTVYITGQSRIRTLGGKFTNSLGVWTSHNGGRTFEGPVRRISDERHYVLEPSNSVVLSNGTLVTLFADIKDTDGARIRSSTSEDSNALLETLTISKQGTFLSVPSKVDDLFLIRPKAGYTGVSASSQPTLALDQGRGPFHGRLYATWADERTGRSAIRFSYSVDSGRTWSKSVEIDDVTGPTEGRNGPNNFLPTVAVNREGVLAVSWYDRRDNPGTLGWYLRIRISLDGGETWLPSRRVSKEPSVFSSGTKLATYAVANRERFNREITQDPAHVTVAVQGREFCACDYAGLAADAQGTFHAFWIDNRTGTAQIWTAPISVDAVATSNGNASFAKLDEASANVSIIILSSDYVAESGSITITVRLKNISDHTLSGPLILRLVGITSPIGQATVVNADPQFAGLDAAWNFSSSLNDSLRPQESSSEKKLIFHLAKSREWVEGMTTNYRLLECDFRVLVGKESHVN